MKSSKPEVVEIDWGHPFTEGLVVMNLGTTFNYASRRHGTLTSGTVVAAGKRGKVLNFNDTSGQGLALPEVPAFSGDEISILSRCEFTDLTIDHTVFGIGTQLLILYADQEGGTDLRAALYWGNFALGPTGGLNTGYHTLGATASRPATNTTGKLYVDGDLVDSSTAATLDDWTTGTSHKIGSNDTANKEAKGNFEYVYVWDRILSDYEIRSLTDDPYQIIKPQRSVYFVPVAVTGGPRAGSLGLMGVGI